MHIETLAVDSLNPYARNSRTHSDAQIAQIAASVREYGFTNPVLIDADGGIIAGHGRVMAARALGMADVPCIRLAHLTDAQKRAYIIADNRLALNAGWDFSHASALPFARSRTRPMKLWRSVGEMTPRASSRLKMCEAFRACS